MVEKQSNKLMAPSLKKNLFLNTPSSTTGD
jgi:hypothetical protein